MDQPDPDSVRCPTCRAEQAWSDACRRCKCDLSLLRSVAEAYTRNRIACLAHLEAGRPDAAWDAAIRCRAIADTEESRRLLAVSAMRRGDWPSAVALARAD